MRPNPKQETTAPAAVPLTSLAEDIQSQLLAECEEIRLLNQTISEAEREKKDRIERITELAEMHGLPQKIAGKGWTLHKGSRTSTSYSETRMLERGLTVDDIEYVRERKVSEFWYVQGVKSKKQTEDNGGSESEKA